MEVEDAPESNELKRQFAEAHRVGWAIANLAVASRPVGLYNRLRAKRKQRKEAALYR